MAKESGKFTSIEEIRASFYPGSVGMLELEKGEILDFPFTPASKMRRIMDDIAKQAAEAEEAEIEEALDK